MVATDGKGLVRGLVKVTDCPVKWAAQTNEGERCLHAIDSEVSNVM